jgi:hypothetical protein
MPNLKKQWVTMLMLKGMVILKTTDDYGKKQGALFKDGP